MKLPMITVLEYCFSTKAYSILSSFSIKLLYKNYVHFSEVHKILVLAINMKFSVFGFFKKLKNFKKIFWYSTFLFFFDSLGSSCIFPSNSSNKKLHFLLKRKFIVIFFFKEALKQKTYNTFSITTIFLQKKPISETKRIINLIYSLQKRKTFSKLFMFSSRFHPVFHAKLTSKLINWIAVCAISKWTEMKRYFAVQGFALLVPESGKSKNET